MPETLPKIPRWENGPAGFVPKANDQLDAIERAIGAMPTPPRQIAGKRVSAAILAKITEEDDDDGLYQAVECLADGSEKTNGRTWDGGAEPNLPELHEISGIVAVPANTVVEVHLGTDAAGNDFWWFNAPLPPGGSKYQSLQILNDDGARGWDYPRAHA